MAATPQPDPGVPILIYVTARLADLDQRLNDRFGRIDDHMRHAAEKSSRESDLVRADLQTIASAVQRVGEKLDTRAGAIEQRVDELESDRDRHTGGRSALRELIIVAAAIVGATGGLNGLGVL